MATHEITAENIETTIAENDIVLLDFWAAWCGPCRQFSPIFERTSEAHPKAFFGKIDTDAEQQLAAAFQISSIPTLVIFREQVPVFAQPGALGQNHLEDLLTQVENLDMDEVRREIAAQQAQPKEAAPEAQTADQS